MVIGTSLSGIVYNKLGFYGAYSISSVLLIIGLSYGLIFLKDVAPSLEVDEKIKNKSSQSIVFEIFDLKLITQSFKATFKKRPQRLRIIILLIILMTNSGTTNGWYSRHIEICFSLTSVEFFYGYFYRPIFI